MEELNKTGAETTESTSVASYLNLLFTQDRSNNITTKLYEKHYIWLSHGELSLHVKQYSISTSLWCLCISAHLLCPFCSNYSDFLLHHRALVTRFLSQGYKVYHLSNIFKKIYGRHTDLVVQYRKDLCQAFADSIS